MFTVCVSTLIALKQHSATGASWCLRFIGFFRSTLRYTFSSFRVTSSCFRRRGSYSFLYQARALSRCSFVLFIVDRNQCLHFRLKSPCRTSLNGIGFSANGPGGLNSTNAKDPGGLNSTNSKSSGGLNSTNAKGATLVTRTSTLPCRSLSRGMVGYVHLPPCKDRTFVTLDLAVALGVVCRCKVILYRHDVASLGKERRRKTAAVVHYGLLWIALVEHLSIAEVAGVYGCG